MQTQCEDKCSGISCWYLDYLDVPENTSVNYPQMTKGSMKIIRITPNSNGTAKIGGSGGKDIYNFSCVICMNDSPGGLEANVGNDFVVIQGGIGQTPVTYNSGVATDIDQNNDINVLYAPPIIVDPNNKLTLKTEYSKLVDLNISPIWDIRDENNQIAYTLTDKLIYLEKGAVVDVSATWAYNTPGINENPPTQTTGNISGNNLPQYANQPTTNPMVHTGITTDKKYIQTIYKPKTGLISQNGQVIPAQGSDVKEDFIEVVFLPKVSFTSTTNGSLSTIDIQNIFRAAGELVHKKRAVINNANTQQTEYFYIVYDKDLGPIEYVSLDGYTSILDAFDFVQDETIVSSSGVTMDVSVYRTTDPGAFSNNFLTLSWTKKWEN